MAGPALADVRVAVSDALTSAILRADADREAASVSVQAEQVGEELVVRVCDAGSCVAARPICPVLGPRLSRARRGAGIGFAGAGAVAPIALVLGGGGGVGSGCLPRRRR